MRGPVGALALAHPGDLEREGDVVDDGAPGKRRLFLEHHAERRVRAAHRLAADGDAPFEFGHQAADDVEQRRLAAA